MTRDNIEFEVEGFENFKEMLNGLGGVSYKWFLFIFLLIYQFRVYKYHLKYNGSH